MGLIGKQLMLFITIIIFTLVITTSCEKDKYTNSLPPETQEGKNTFGCYVNNNLWQKGNPTFFHPAYGANLKDGSLKIYSDGGKSDERKSIGISISGIAEAKKYYLNRKNNRADYEDYILRCYYETDTLNNIGEVEITKLDTIKKIVSGTFRFKAKKSWYAYSNLSSDCDSFVNITQGRFDLIYSEY